jgi:magnesium transporter
LLKAFTAAAVVGVFAGTIAKVATLAVWLPVVAGQGGNTIQHGNPIVFSFL